MEHITQKDLENGMVMLTPDDGYMLFDERTQKRHSEAVVKKEYVRYFNAMPIEDGVKAEQMPATA